MLELKKPRLDFGTIFKDFISKYNPYCYYDNDWDEWDDFDDVNYLGYLRGNYFPHGHNSLGSSVDWGKNKRKILRGIDTSSSHRGKRGSKRNKKKSSIYKNDRFGRFNNLFDDDDINDFDCLGMDAKTIYFYRDINNPDDYEEFYNLFEFDNFLRDEGIKITDYEVQKLMNRDISHCCCQNENGDVWLLSDHSYGSLYYEACESFDESINYSC